MSAAVLQRHRKAWAAKPALRQVYKNYFREIMRLCAPQRPIVEIGSGCGLFREFYPEVIATDIAPTEWTDLTCDAAALPFAYQSIGNIVLIDVFHHLGDPHRFLREAARVLRYGGRVVMLEPWTSPAGYLLYRYVHHETADYSVDPARPFPPEKDAFAGNAALPRIYFDHRRSRPEGYLDRMGLRLRCLRRLPAINWLLSGGFQKFGIAQRSRLNWLNALDRMCQPFSRWLALRVFVVIEKAERRDPRATRSGGACARPLVGPRVDAILNASPA